VHDVRKGSGDVTDYAQRITDALRIAEAGQLDGAHHKMWVIDQMVRALTGCPTITKTANDYRGVPYQYEALGESDEYRARIAAYRDGEDGPETYDWDEGVPP
jgi:hypothetical protein